MKRLVLIYLVLSCTLVVNAQYFPKNPTIYGSHMLRLKADSALNVPEKDSLFTSTTDTTAQIFYNRLDSSFWGYSRARGFFKVTGGVGTRSDSLDVSLLSGGKIDPTHIPLSDGLISTGGISLVDSTLTIEDTIRWSKNGTIYTQNIPSVFTISSADTGFYRSDLIYANASGLHLIKGVEDTLATSPPALPADAITVTVVNVFGSFVSKPAPAVIGQMDYVSDIRALENYTKTSQIIVVQDTLRGGVFSLVHSPLVPDSGTIFKSQFAGSYWVRNYTGYTVNAHWFGAAGDGSDATQSIQLAINALAVNKGHTGGTVHIPAGLYTISSAIKLGDRVSMSGDFWATTLQLAANANCNMFENPSDAGVGYLSIADLRMLGNDGNNISGSCFSIKKNGFLQSDIYFRHLLIAHFKDNGIYVENGWQYHIESCVIEFIWKNVLLFKAVGTDSYSSIRRVTIQNNNLFQSPLSTTGNDIISFEGKQGSRDISGIQVVNNYISQDFQTGTSATVGVKGVYNFNITANRIQSHPHLLSDSLVLAIRIDSGSVHGIITSNTIASSYSDNTDSPTYLGSYGVNILDSSHNIVLALNDFYNFQKKNIVLDATVYDIDTLFSGYRAGNNISIVGNTISATGGGTTGGSTTIAGYGLLKTDSTTMTVDTTIIVSKALANAVYATIASMNLKANDNSVVHITGSETISGIKTFTDSVKIGLNADGIISVKTGLGLIINANQTSSFRLLPYLNDIWFQNSNANNVGNINFSGKSASVLTGNVKFFVNGYALLNNDTLSTRAYNRTQFEPVFNHNTGFNLPLSTSLTDSSNSNIMSSGQFKRDSIRADHISGTIPATKLPSYTLNFRRPYLRYDSANKTVWFDSSLVSSGGSSHTFQSGTYLPTVLAASNTGYTMAVGAGYDGRFFYTRMDSIVTVSGYFTIIPTTNANTFVTFSLPISSNFTQPSDVAGSIGGGFQTFVAGLITADTGLKGIAVVTSASGSGGGRTFSFTCQYIIK